MTTPSLVVPDASVILKWVFESPDEKDGDKALDLLNFWLAGTCEFILPKLWAFECGNVIGLKNPDNAEKILEVLLGYRFLECEMNDALCRTALKILRDCKVTFYDAAYHAVALEHHGLFVTADAAYYGKAKAKGHIMMLKDLALTA